MAFGGGVYAGGEINSPYTLTVNVPTGAQTGPITVTTGSTVITTATPFVVTSPPAVPAFTSATKVEGTINQPFSFQVTANGNPTSYAILTGELPPGLSFDTATGLISGTPTEAIVTGLNISATNANGTGQASLIIDIGNDAPTLTVTASPKTINAAPGQSAQFLFTLSHAATRATVINYLIHDVAPDPEDYGPNPLYYSLSKAGRVKIPAGKTSATLTLTPVDLPFPDSPDTLVIVKLTISDGRDLYVVGTPKSAKIKIHVSE